MESGWGVYCVDNGGFTILITGGFAMQNLWAADNFCISYVFCNPAAVFRGLWIVCINQLFCQIKLSPLFISRNFGELFLYPAAASVD